MSNHGDNDSIRQLTPYLTVHDAAAAIEFYKSAFGAVEDFRLTEPDGRIGHAELKFGNFVLMLAAEYPEVGFRGPLALGGSPVTLHMAVDNVDLVAKRAVDAGAKMIREPKDEFYGERSCRIEDPFGHKWGLSQTIETLSPEEMQRRYNALFE
jgi:uncharacterized glyoxalase superfamily protein PhnB